jgi:hypothetical protein
MTASVRQRNVERSGPKCPETLDLIRQVGQYGWRTGKRTPIPLTYIGYARGSTVDQDPALQLDALASAGRAKVFEDRASGARADRAGLRAALEYVREGDVLIVWKLDRLGRSLPPRARRLVNRPGWLPVSRLPRSPPMATTAIRVRSEWCLVQRSGIATASISTTGWSRTIVA